MRCSVRFGLASRLITQDPIILQELHSHDRRQSFNGSTQLRLPWKILAHLMGAAVVQPPNLISVAVLIRACNRRAAAFDVGVVNENHSRPRTKNAVKASQELTKRGLRNMRPPKNGQTSDKLP